MTSSSWTLPEVPHTLGNITVQWPGGTKAVIQELDSRRRRGSGARGRSPVLRAERAEECGTRYEAGKPGKGELAPEFSLPMVGGRIFSLADYRGQKKILLFFQEGIGCDACWKQAQDLQAQRDFYGQHNVEVATIAIDPLPDLQAVVAEYGLTLSVLSDNDKSISRTYDMLDFGMHPGIRPAHSFVLIGEDGTILWRADYGAPPRAAMYVPENEIRDAVAAALR